MTILTWEEVYEKLPECYDPHCKVKAVALYASGEKVDDREVVIPLCARHFIKYINKQEINP